MSEAWKSPFEQGGALRRLEQWVLAAASAALARLGGRIQARMNIDPSSCWHDPRFVARFGASDLAAPLRHLHWPDCGDTVRRDMLLLLAGAVARNGVEGAVAEVGIRQGMTADALLAALPTRQFVLIDTLCGFTREDLAAEMAATGQKVCQPFAPDPRATRRLLDRVAKRPNVRLIQTDVADLEGCDLNEQNYALVHIDVDLWRPVSAALAYFGTRMQAGGYIAVHDYNAWPGARMATDEFMARGLAKGFVPMPDKSGTGVLLF